MGRFRCLGGARSAPPTRSCLFGLLEQVDRIGGGRRQADRVPVYRRDEPGGQIMMLAALAVFGLRAVGLGQLDALAVEMIDGTDRDTVGADDSHIFLDRAMVMLCHGESPCRSRGLFRASPAHDT